MLHSDAKRLFAGEGEGEDVWQTEYELKKYKSLKQAGRHAVRDGTAFASIAVACSLCCYIFCTVASEAETRTGLAGG